MMKQFVIPVEVQEFLSSLPSTAVGNVVWNFQPPGSNDTIPFDPSSVRRMIAYSKSSYTDEATPELQYNSWLKSLDTTVDVQITFSRGI